MGLDIDDRTQGGTDRIRIRIRQNQKFRKKKRKENVPKYNNPHFWCTRTVPCYNALLLLRGVSTLTLIFCMCVVCVGR